MKIWLITLGEPLPIDGNHPRLLKSARLAQWLSGRGHTVSMFTNRFDHYNRIQRKHRETKVSQSPHLCYYLLEAPGYENSVSMARILHHRVTALKFKVLARDLPKPDIIVCSFPTFELCKEAMKIAHANAIPIVIDVRDYWPDALIELTPKTLKPIIRCLTSPIRQFYTSQILRADAVSSNSYKGLEWVYSNRKIHRPLDFEFPLSYPPQTALKHETTNESSVFKIAFFGALTKKTNIIPFIDAISDLNQSKYRFELLICGAGDLAKKIQDLSKEHTFLKYFGWVNSRELQEIALSCDFGLLPYKGDDFSISAPNKLSEYLACALPILTCTTGVTKDILDKYRCGIFTETSHDSIISSLEKISHRELRLMKKKALNAFNENFSDDLVFKRVEERLLLISKTRKV